MIVLQGKPGALFSPGPGELYAAGPDGRLELPDHHLDAALRHGFVRIPGAAGAPSAKSSDQSPAGARLVHAGFGRYFAHDAEGRRLNDKPLPKPAAAALLAAPEA